MPSDMGVACPECGHAMSGGTCLNIDCSRAREQAAAGAARDTAKAGAPMMSTPRAFQTSGRVD